MAGLQFFNNPLDYSQTVSWFLLLLFYAWQALRVSTSEAEQGWFACLMGSIGQVTLITHI
jgi:hypothetical protein